MLFLEIAGVLMSIYKCGNRYNYLFCFILPIFRPDLFLFIAQFLVTLLTVDCFQLDIAGDQPTPSHSHTACLWQDTKMVVAGGLSADFCPLNSVYVIDLESCVSQVMELTPTLSPRYSHTAHVVDDKIFLIGGINPHGAYCYTVSIINLTAAICCEYSLPVFDVDRPLMFHGHTSELLTATKILIIGGGGNCFSFGTHLNDTPVEIGVPL